MSIKTDRINSIIQTLNSASGTSFSQFFVPSLNEKIKFKPITVGKQKILSKNILENKDKFSQYELYNNLINDLCVDQSKFDIYELTIIDRYKVLFDIFSVNNYDRSLDLMCERETCKKSIEVSIPYAKFAEELSKVPLIEVPHTYTDGNNVYEFILSYPKVKRVQELYKVENGEANDINSLVLSGIEYIKLFIKTLVLRQDGVEVLNLDFNDMKVTDTMEIFANIPNTTFTNFGVMEKIDSELISKISSITHDVVCKHCGSKHDQPLNLHTFFLIS